MTTLAGPDSITRQQEQDYTISSLVSPVHDDQLGAVIISLGAIVLLAKVLRLCLRSLKDKLQADAADRRGRRAQIDGERRHVCPFAVDAGGIGGGDGVVALAPHQQPPAPAAVAVEMVRAMGPLVCTYLKADGWPAQAACAVCLAELADGEAVRMLPVCMHYFHATCVGEWLRAHDTCPLCCAPLAPPAADGAGA